jgi:hypothetical protein
MPRERSPRSVLIPTLLAVAVAAYAAWYYSPPESPATAYQRIQRAWVDGDHGAEWDRLSTRHLGLPRLPTVRSVG